MSRISKDGRTVCSCRYHVVFSPKYRRKVLYGKVKYRLKGLIWEKQFEYGYRVLDMEVMPDHVHLLLDVKPSDRIEVVVQKIKGYSSRVLRQEFPKLQKLPSLWTRSKYIGSVGAVSIEVVKKYINNQTKV